MRAPRHAVLGVACLALGLAACGPPPLPDFPSLEISVPDPALVDEVVFLVGDAGAALDGRSPILEDLSARIERWTAAIARDSSVSVVFLGDVVYPVGVRDRDHPEFPQDSAHLWSQIGLVSGPEARRRQTLGLFLAGNHDWGNMTGEAGIRRLSNLEAQLAEARSRGIRVDLLPAPGSPGPEVVDLRNNTRLLAVDTHWFLQERSSREKDLFFERLLAAMQGAGDRHVVFVAHHPYASAGEHGAMVPVGEALGLLFLLKKSGTLIQDLNSPVYLDLLARLRTAFIAADRVPLVWAGGHDHSLQVLRASGEWEPRYQLVSGSASKLTGIRSVPNLEWGAVQTGYMMLFLLTDGSVRLFVVASDSDVLLCPEESDEERSACLTREASRFGLRYSELLAGPVATARTPLPQQVVIPTTELTTKQVEDSEIFP